MPSLRVHRASDEFARELASRVGRWLLLGLGGIIMAAGLVLAPPAAAGGVLYGRATRALANYVENFTPFIALALALIVTQRAGGAGALGATIWVLARIAYIPLYLFGVIYVRTAAWTISIIGLVMMLWRLIGW